MAGGLPPNLPIGQLSPGAPAPGMGGPPGAPAGGPPGGLPPMPPRPGNQAPSGMMNMLMFLAGVGFPHAAEGLSKFKKAMSDGAANKSGPAQDARTAPTMTMSPMLAQALAAKAGGPQGPAAQPSGDDNLLALLSQALGSGVMGK